LGYGAPPVPIAERKRRRDAVEEAYKKGFSVGIHGGPKVRIAALTEAATRLRINRGTLYGWCKNEEILKDSGKEHFFPDYSKYQPPLNLKAPGHQDAIEHAPAASWTKGHALELTSFKDNTFLFGAAGDLHAGSKYCRWDVREALYEHFINEGAQCNFDTGNWIDGEAAFNRFDIEVHGVDRQCRHLAANHPRGLPTYAVWGDDHEGWYVQREGINVGKYNERIMQEEGHAWVDMGYMEAHVMLKNANSGKSVPMSVVHPGGGSAYAISYSIQKIVESLEGGEKPAVGLYGHYHKLMAALTRNVWWVQTGCQQDQTPFMRKKRLEAHVGGALIKLRQDPRDGTITSMTPELIRYFNKGYYAQRRWSKHDSVTGLPRVPPRARPKRRKR